MFIVLIFSFTACFNTSETQKSQDDENTADDSGDTSDDDEEIYCTVTLVDNMSDKPTNLIEIKKGNKLSEISLKDSEDYFFVGWYIDENFTQPYDFAAPVESDFTLYAKWLKKQDVELYTNNTLYLCKDGTADLSDVLPGSGYVAYGNMATITGSLITLSGVGRFTLRYTPSGSTGTTDVTVNVINGQNAGDWSELVSAINAGKNVALYRDITAPVGADTVAITNSVIYGNAKEIVVNNIVKGDIDNRGKNAFDVSGNGKAYFYDTIISGYKSEESEISDLTQFDGYGQLINVVNNDNNLRPDVLVKHCILQNGQKMMYVKGANVVVEGSVFRNGSDALLAIETGSVKGANVMVKNSVFSNSRFFGICLCSWEDIVDDSYYCSLNFDGFVDIYNWKERYAENSIPPSIGNSMVIELINDLIKGEAAKDKYDEFYAKDSDGNEYFHFGLLIVATGKFDADKLVINGAENVGLEIKNLPLPSMISALTKTCMVYGIVNGDLTIEPTEKIKDNPLLSQELIYGRVQ